MNFSLIPSLKGGTVTCPKSEAEAHRLFIMSALSDNLVRTDDFEFCEDIEATVSCVRKLGTKIERKNGFIDITPYISGMSEEMDCKSSASTLRFILPVIAAFGITAKVIAEPSLAKRPHMPLYKALCEHGFLISSPQFPIFCGKKIHGGEYSLDTSASSQYATGLLLVLPLLEENSTLTLTGNPVSMQDIALTVDMLKKFGIETECHGTAFYIRGNQRYKSPGVFSLGGDWSSAAVWLCAGALSQNTFTVQGLETYSLQDDKNILTYLEKFGANITRGEKSISVCGKERRAFDVDLFATQNIFPELAVLAAVAKGTSHFYNAKNLNIRESNRLRFVTQMLIRLGAVVNKTDDGFDITGKPFLLGGAVSSYGDSKVAMAAALAAQVCIKKVLLNGAEAVNKSYPAFFYDYRHLGGEVFAHI